MSDDFERLVIGSSHEGAEGMFNPKEIEKEIDTAELERIKQERGILPNAQERLEQTLAERGLEQVRELENGIQYPTLDQWVKHRIEYKRGTKFFPSFVKDKEGTVFFCKAQLTDNPTALQGLEREAERLNDIPEGVSAPRLVEYIPAQDNRSALLITEAISMGEATVAHPDLWSAEHAQDAARQIKIMEEKKIEPQEKNPDFTASVRNLLDKAGATISPDLRRKIEHALSAYEPYAAARFVHGDSTTKNILPGVQDSSVRFVDWEFEGHGFLGQDAAKLWSELQRNQEVGEAFLDSYLRNTDGSIDQARKSALAFGVAAESLVHLAWRNENIIAPGKQAEHPQLELELQDFTGRIADIIESTEKVK